jgi:hydrogenase maturation protease
MHTLIIGYGNPLRQDDGVGWYIAQRLLTHTTEGASQESPFIPTLPNTTVIACHQLSLELAAPVSQADLVIFVDAQANGMAGSVWVEEYLEIPVEVGAFSHNVTPALLLATAQELYGSRPRGFLLSVSGEWWGYGEQFSPAVQAALPILKSHMQRLISETPLPDFC